MYRISKIITLSILGFLASQTFAIKLTNGTDDSLLYCCGNPADKSLVLPKYDLKPQETVEISCAQGYIQIYTKQRPNALNSKYALTNQTEDLTIVRHRNPMLGYAFKPTEEEGQMEPSRKLPTGAVSLFGSATSKPITVQVDATKSDNKKKQEGQKENQGTKSLSTILKEKPKYPGKRLPSRRQKNCSDKAPTPSAEEQRDILIEQLLEQLCNDTVQQNIIDESAQSSIPKSHNKTVPADKKRQDNIEDIKLSEQTVNNNIKSSGPIINNNPRPNIKPIEKKHLDQLAKAKAALLLKKADPELKQSIYKRYLTKKSLAAGIVGLGALGTISYTAWIFYRMRTFFK